MMRNNIADMIVLKKKLKKRTEKKFKTKSQ